MTLAVSAAACSADSYGSTGSGGGSDKEYEAFEICKDFVKDRLKAPSTAKFRNYFEDDGEVTVSGSGSGPYTVISSVDSENSFGAALRSNFVCVVNNTGGANWRLADISIT